jgi:hypothetical protein
MFVKPYVSTLPKRLCCSMLGVLGLCFLPVDATAQESQPTFSGEMIGQFFDQNIANGSVSYRLRCGCPKAWRSVSGTIGFANLQQEPYEFSGFIGEGTLFGFNFSHSSKTKIEDFQFLINKVSPIKTAPNQKMKIISKKIDAPEFEGFSDVKVTGKRDKRYKKAGVFVAIAQLGQDRLPLIIPVEANKRIGQGYIIDTKFISASFTELRFFVTYSPARIVSLSTPR